MKKLTLAQVKALARKHGQVTVLLFPSNCGPSNTTWVQGTEYTIKYNQESKQFLKVIPYGVGLLSFHLESFKHYNCNKELGYRIHYYIAEPSDLEPESENIEMDVVSPAETIQHTLELIPHAETDEERDSLYKVIQDNLSHQEVTQTHVMEVWYIFDHLYFDKETAELFEDGKETPQLQYIIAESGDTVQEGSDDFPRYDTYEDAMEELKTWID